MNIRSLLAFLFLSFSLLLCRSVSAQAPPFSYRGLYDATLTDGTKAYFFVRKDGDVRFAQFDSVNRTVINATFTIAANGSFAFQVGTVNIAGAFSATGVTGTIDALAFNIPRTPLNSVDGSLEGYYSGWSFNFGFITRPVQDVQFVLSPSGNFYGLITQSSVSPGPFATVGFIGTYAQNGTITSQEITGNTGPYNGNVSVTDGIMKGFINGVARYDIQLAKENVPYRITNISTRGKVGTLSEQMIAGFIITNGAKRVIIRALGPSLSQFNVPGVLGDPIMELHSATTLVATNDNWQVGNDVAAINATGLAPSNAAESALLVTLEEGPYTVIVSGVGGTTGVALVEVYEID